MDSLCDVLCMKSSSIDRPQACKICFTLAVAKICKRCQDSINVLTINTAFKNSFGAIQCLFRYDDIIVDLVRRAKISNDLDALKTLFDLSLASGMPQKAFLNYDLIVPIPSSFRSRLRGRFDIPAWFCERYKLIFGAHIMYLPWAHYFFKPKRAGVNTDKLKNGARLNSYATSWHEHKSLRFTSQVIGKKILLIDDVITTGFTISEAQRFLMQSGAYRVDGLVVGSAHDKSDNVKLF